MVLDALSVVSLAATIIQFVDFGSKIVSKGYHLYESTDGVLPEYARLGYLIARKKSGPWKICLQSAPHLRRNCWSGSRS
jgi:hypothetical protein